MGPDLAPLGRLEQGKATNTEVSIESQAYLLLSPFIFTRIESKYLRPSGELLMLTIFSPHVANPI